MYKFATLDPRPIPAAQIANDAVFGCPQCGGTGGAIDEGSDGPCHAGPYYPRVYGIEVTVPSLAARCVTNIDPQHTGGNAEVAAIEVALTCELPPDGAMLATVRPDLDSVGAMAIMAMRADGRRESLMIMSDDGYPMAYSQEGNRFDVRIRMVADADKFARGDWPGPRPLPTVANPWPAGGSAESTQPLAAMAAAVADFKVPLDQRVSLMEAWLLMGEEPAQYRAQVERERADLVSALERDEIKAETKNGLAVVETTHRAATLVGYCLAPVVVALNPAFRLSGGDPHRKFTVCQFKTGHCDLKAATADLQALETGWGGSPTIIGSPQGVSSALTLERVTEVVARHLKS